jgi:hypothetical protein
MAIEKPAHVGFGGRPAFNADKAGKAGRDL